MTPVVDIVIVSYNTKGYLEACLRSLHEHPPTVRHTTTVVDNASRDGSAEMVRRGWPDVRLIHTGDNLGFARANNLGIRATHGTFILLLNSDTVVSPGAIDGLVDRLTSTPDTAAVGPRLIDGAGNVELSFGPMMGALNELRQRCRTAALSRGTPIFGAAVARSLARPGYPDWVTGACLLVRRIDAEAVGLIDERYLLYGEDVDFCAALRARHRKILFSPDIEIIHYGGRSGRAFPRQTRQLYRRSKLAFYAKHHPHWLPLLRVYLKLRRQIHQAEDE